MALVFLSKLAGDLEDSVEVAVVVLIMVGWSGGVKA